jgi:hypothetical protein
LPSHECAEQTVEVRPVVGDLLALIGADGGALETLFWIRASESAD